MISETFDVLIIGSGHAGGMAAKILTESGIRCLILNAGPVADVSRNAEHKAAYELPYRGFKPPGRLEHVFQANEFNANVWVDERRFLTPSTKKTRITGFAYASSVGGRSSGHDNHSV
jgi:choline dehydrogenase-like flavoprotein